MDLEEIKAAIEDLSDDDFWDLEDWIETLAADEDEDDAADDEEDESEAESSAEGESEE